MTPQDHPHYHSREKGCRVVTRRDPESQPVARFCKTHQEEVCGADQCPWNQFWHGGEYTEPRVKPPVKVNG